MTKDPEDYNEDDIREIKAYEAAVQFRMNERQHYRKQLDSDYRRVKHSLKVRFLSYSIKHTFEVGSARICLYLHVSMWYQKME